MVAVAWEDDIDQAGWNWSDDQFLLVFPIEGAHALAL
jgi:hypothetical protein